LKGLLAYDQLVIAVWQIIIWVMNNNGLGVRGMSRCGRIRNLDRADATHSLVPFATKYGLLFSGLSLTVTGHVREDLAQCGNESGSGT